MALQVVSPAPPVWDCHICGAPAAFVGHPERMTTVPQRDGSFTHGLFHDDGFACRWRSSDPYGRENVQVIR